MKQFLNVTRNPKTVDIAILVTIVVVALLMLSHGIPKLNSLLSTAPIQFPGLFGMSPAVALGLTVFAEVLCSIFILIGAGTRFAVIPLAITMLVAILVIHAADPFANKEPAIHYLLLYIVLFITGSGRYSIDGILQKREMRLVFSKR